MTPRDVVNPSCSSMAAAPSLLRCAQVGEPRGPGGGGWGWVVSLPCHWSTSAHRVFSHRVLPGSGVRIQYQLLKVDCCMHDFAVLPGACAGVEEALSTMKAGGRRVVKVPAALGFGDRGAVLRPTEHVPDKQGVVPPGADLEYDLELVRVSIPPS